MGQYTYTAGNWYDQNKKQVYDRDSIASLNRMAQEQLNPKPKIKALERLLKDDGVGGAPLIGEENKASTEAILRNTLSQQAGLNEPVIKDYNYYQNAGRVPAPLGQQGTFGGESVESLMNEINQSKRGGEVTNKVLQNMFYSKGLKDDKTMGVGGFQSPIPQQQLPEVPEQTYTPPEQLPMFNPSIGNKFKSLTDYLSFSNPDEHFRKMDSDLFNAIGKVAEPTAKGVGDIISSLLPRLGGYYKEFYGVDNKNPNNKKSKIPAQSGSGDQPFVDQETGVSYGYKPKR